MTKEVKGALCEWGAGIVVGVIPLFAHLCAWFVIKTQPNAHHALDITIEMIFAAITIAAAGPVSAATRLLKGSLDLARLGRRTLLLIALAGLPLVIGALTYGAIAADAANEHLGGLAVSVLFMSLVLSLILELTIAAALVP